MNFRVSDNSLSSDFASRINVQRSRLNLLQERLSSGKRINRPSDDPSGAEAVLNLRTSLEEISQFQRNAQTANQKLTAADAPLNDYETALDRVRTLVSQGLNDTGTQETRDALALEIESLRSRILGIANTKYDNEYLFGGTRQNAPPFDPTTGVLNAAPTGPQYMQIEPGANPIPVGITADTFFSDATSTIFTDLTDAVNALRGTGNPATDRTTLENTMSRLNIYGDLVNVAHTRIGINMNFTEIARERLTTDSLTFNDRISAIEDADFAETAVGLADTQRALDATLQVTAQRRRSLFDFFG